MLFSEINPQAAETYIANRMGMDIVPVSDIYNLTDVDLGLLKTYWRYKNIEDIDLVCGGRRVRAIPALVIGARSSWIKKTFHQITFFKKWFA